MVSSKKGGILIYMLGVVALLGLVVTEFLMEVGGEVLYRAQITGRQDMELVARSALETTLGVLYEIKEIDEGLFSPVQGWGDPLVYAEFKVPDGYEVSVEIRDETRKLSLYKDKELLYIGNLMSEAGMSLENLVNFKSELKKWLGVEEEGDRDVPVNKKGRRLHSYEELAQVEGVASYLFDDVGNPNSYCDVFKENVSFVHDGLVNINTASKVLKKTLVNNENLTAKDVGKNYFKTMGDLGLGEGMKGGELKDVMDFQSTVFDIGVSVMRGGVAYYLNAIVALDASKGKEKKSSEYRILALTEDANFIH